MSSPTIAATAMFCRGGTVRAEPVALEQPAPGELLLAVRVAGLCGTDLFKLAHRLADGQVLGHEVVGKVAAVGNGIDGFRIGDRVVTAHHVPCGDCHLCRLGNGPQCPAFAENLLHPGGFATHLLVRRRAVARSARAIPDQLADEAAVFMEPAACVLRGIRRSGLLADGSAGGGDDPPVAVLGAGSMGLLHHRLLRVLLPASEVTLFDLDPARRQRAAALGARALPPPSSGDFEVVFDTAGGATALRSALALSRPGGTVVLFAHGARDEVASFAINDLFKREQRLVSTYSSTPEEQEEAFGLLVTGVFDPRDLVSDVLPLGALGAAVELTRQRRALKILLTPSREEASLEAT